jgi:hypothetical protein
MKVSDKSPVPGANIPHTITARRALSRPLECDSIYGRKH